MAAAGSICPSSGGNPKEQRLLSQGMASRRQHLGSPEMRNEPSCQAEGNGMATSAKSQRGRGFLLTPEMLLGASLPLGLSCHDTHPKLHTECGTGRCYTGISHGLPGTGSHRGDKILLSSAVTPSSSSGTGHLCWILLILGWDSSKGC